MSEDIQSLAAKHQREIMAVQEKYSQLLEEKDNEIAAFLKEQKQLTANQQKDLENLHQAHTSKIAQLENDHRKALDVKQKEIQSKSLEIRWLEDEVNGYESKTSEHDPNVEQLRLRCEGLEAEKRTAQTVNHNLRQEADGVRAENSRLVQ
jgi:predicted component of type VI protein secretion system